MLFDTPVFIFYFLPSVLIAYAISPFPLKNIVLLFASLLFYAWGEGFFVLQMLILVMLNYIAGYFIERANTTNRAFCDLSLIVLTNLLFLAFYKYAAFLMNNFARVFELPVSTDLANIGLPIGISFFTFQAISYVIDVYRKDTVAQRNPVTLALYICLFPQLIAGPIVRYTQIAEELKQRRVDILLFGNGVTRFIIGLAKKVLLADQLSLRSDLIFSLSDSELNTGTAWIGVLCFSLQIYFDFSGYSDMAIGLGKMFGFNIPENFSYPYIAPFHAGVLATLAYFIIKLVP